MQQPTSRSAVVLLSGGLDSAVVAAIARSDGFDLHALHFIYGQRHAVESTAAQRISDHLGIRKLMTMSLDLRAFGGSALTDDIAVPKFSTDEPDSASEGARPTNAAGAADTIPVTYVPARNTIFLSLALAYAEANRLYDIFIGINALDYSGYPDCRPAFVAAFEQLANVATKAGVEGRRFNIHAPLLYLDKAAIIRRGADLGVNFGLTHSCYDPDAGGRACGRCESCNFRCQGFINAGLADPTVYQSAGSDTDT